MVISPRRRSTLCSAKIVKVRKGRQKKMKRVQGFSNESNVHHQGGRRDSLRVGF